MFIDKLGPTIVPSLVDKIVPVGRLFQGLSVGEQFRDFSLGMIPIGGIFYFRKGCQRNDVRNNIFAFNKKRDCGYDNGGGKLGDPSENLDDYNCYFPGKPDPKIRPGAHELLANPRFKNAATGDFRLLSNSPCKGKGTPLDSSKEKRRHDLGAFSPSSQPAGNDV